MDLTPYYPVSILYFCNSQSRESAVNEESLPNSVEDSPDSFGCVSPDL